MSYVRADTIVSTSGRGAIMVDPTNTLYAPGHAIQTQNVIIGPASQTISSATPVGVTGLSIAFTPKNANSMILITSQVSSNSPHVSSFAIYKNGAATVSTSGYTNSNEPNMQVTTYLGTDVTSELWSWSLMWYELAGNTTARTYQVYASAAWAGTPRALQINNRSSNDMASFSYMTIMEIAQ